MPAAFLKNCLIKYVKTRKSSPPQRRGGSSYDNAHYDNYYLVYSTDGY